MVMAVIMTVLLGKLGLVILLVIVTTVMAMLMKMVSSDDGGCDGQDMLVSMEISRMVMVAWWQC